MQAKTMFKLSVLASALALAGVVIALGGWLFGPGLIQLLYSQQYAGAARPLQILSLAVLPTFINYALTHFLVALRRQRLNLLFNIIIFGVNLALCLVLIPQFGSSGAALATGLSEGVLLILCVLSLLRITHD